jgi:peptide/nickel transport system substrate-binding protein
MTRHISRQEITRRKLVQAAGAGLFTMPIVGSRLLHAQSTPAAVKTVPELVIDLSGEPVSIDPAVAYAPTEWSIVHSIYDALVGFDSQGVIRPIAAETFEIVDEVTFEAKLRDGMTFHDGSPVTSDAVIRGMEHLQQGASLVIDLFSTVTEVQRIDDLTVRIVCDQPSPWLPAQMAAWHVLLPEGVTDDSLANAPVGSGPYRLASWERGNEIVLDRFEGYQPAAAKGVPVTDRVRYHFVPDATTRLSNLLSDGSHLVSDVPFDLLGALEETGSKVVSQRLVGSNWIRIATDMEPFSDVRVRQALNLALDIDSFRGALIFDDAHRLASIHPGEESMGFDPALEPYPFDPERARVLLEEAGVGDSLDTILQFTTSQQQTVMEAIAAQWGEVGVRVELQAADYATFNADWSDPSAPPLKMASWSPLYDPHTLLSLVWAGDGVLSRYDNPDVTQLIHDAAVEPDTDRRTEMYQELATIMFKDAAAVWLWNQVTVYGLAESAPQWSSRPDEWVLALTRN